MHRLASFFFVALSLRAQVDSALLDKLAEQLKPEDRAFTFAAMGDQQYGPEGERKWPALVASVNRLADQMAFIVHVGDIKNGSTPCTDEMFADRLQWFNRFRMPFILTPGDNEWTDCNRAAAGGYDPLERLKKLRETFFANDESLGERKRRLVRQQGTFLENALWAEGGMLFATLHIVGSNNNFEVTEEYTARNKATLDWMRTAFALAKRNGFGGVVLVTQADFAFPLGVGTGLNSLAGWADSLRVLEEETVAFGKPVLMIHGDTHFFRFDKPLAHAGTRAVVDNFFRLEVPGETDVHWVRVDVDPATPDSPFRVQHMTVRENAR